MNPADAVIWTAATQTEHWKIRFKPQGHTAQGPGFTSKVMNPADAVIWTATTQKEHWKISSMVSEWKSKFLRASLFSRTMLADAAQYARPENTCVAAA